MAVDPDELEEKAKEKEEEAEKLKEAAEEAKKAEEKKEEAEGGGGLFGWSIVRLLNILQIGP